MHIALHKGGGSDIAEVTPDAPISTAQEALELMMDPDLQGARKIILRREDIAPEFFDLSTGLAGEMVQKFVNYRVQLAIVGSFEDASESLKAFIRESNRGGHLFFAKNTEEAIGITW